MSYIKGKMDKVNRTKAAKLIVFLTCALLVVSFYASAVDISAEPSDENWVAHPMFELNPLAPGTQTPQGYSPSQLRTAYNLPSSGGNGTTIAIVDAYHTPTIWSDLGNFSAQFNLPLPTSSNFIVHKMNSIIGTDVNWTKETCLDVEWAHAIAPNATILLVEAKDSTSSSLYAAVDYAASQPGVVAVSLSWGNNEYSGQVNRDSSFSSKPGIGFFVSSGDDGTVSYPSSSPYVVAVGGTRLTLRSDGTVSEETGWNGSGGGLSQYENRPDYQTTYGLTSSKRSIPDVSYNADPDTGVSVYINGLWYKIGGTSAGAPQWAAIHAIGVSATNNNLYQKAKAAYASYFRDITSGSNAAYSATAGYDYVTGLGSPLTFKFANQLDITPTYGPARGSITLSGTSFTAGSSVNISYLNPINNTWNSIISNYAIATENFTYTLTAPDLLQNNLAGDHTAASDKIIFRAQDNNNSRAYNATVPYTEWRRGISQISNATAIGLFGNNTNMASTLFVQNSQSITISGNYFTPGNASLLWDNTTSLGTAVIDGGGFFSAIVQVPVTTAGPHRLTINDGSSNFCINLTRLPKVTDNYSDSWRTQNFAINLTPDYNITETYYRINNGSTLNVTSNGQPLITTEGNNNTLEYWSAWTVYGTGDMNLTHVTLQGIKLDKTPPLGNITATPTTSTPTITLTVSATDTSSGIAQMCFSNDNSTWSNWEPYATTKTWNLTDGDGQKTVTAKFLDNAGLASTTSCSVTLQTPQPTATPTPTPTATPTPIPTANPTQTPTSTPTQTTLPSPTNSPTILPSPSPEIPELEVMIVFLTIAIFTAVFVAIVGKRK
jgi:hypothetical protein